eukprot:SAG31_NODE_579_length_13948_cov_5.599105_7_plen_43_part_00
MAKTQRFKDNKINCPAALGLARDAAEPQWWQPRSSTSSMLTH